jgi:threonine/homoserine/homoserine lactone efflux protein
MSLELWIAFVLAATLILIIPGPTIMLVVSQAVAHGPRSVVPVVAGVFFGDFTAMTFSLLGLGALLAASAALFSLFKWVGALYLFYLGIKLWRLQPEKGASGMDIKKTSTGSMFYSSYIVTALNPKGIAFFVAFLPQFISSSSPLLPQLLILGATFLFLATLNATLYALFAGRLRAKMANSRVRRWFNRCGGSALIGAGLATAAMQAGS